MFQSTRDAGVLLPDERAIQVTQLVAENIPAFWGFLALEVRV